MFLDDQKHPHPGDWCGVCYAVDDGRENIDGIFFKILTWLEMT